MVYSLGEPGSFTTGIWVGGAIIPYNVDIDEIKNQLSKNENP